MNEIPDIAFTALLNGRISGLPIERWNEDRQELELDTEGISFSRRRTVSHVPRIGIPGHLLEAFAGGAETQTAAKWPGRVLTIEGSAAGVSNDPTVIFGSPHMLARDWGTGSGERRWCIDDDGVIVGMFSWSINDSRRFVADCAEHMLDTRFPDDRNFDACREMIEAERAAITLFDDIGSGDDFRIEDRVEERTEADRRARLFFKFDFPAAPARRSIPRHLGILERIVSMADDASSPGGDPDEAQWQIERFAVYAERSCRSGGGVHL